MSSKRDYIIIAQAISEARLSSGPSDSHSECYEISEFLVSEALDTVADKLATVFEADNPRFDREKFLEACR